MFISIKGIDDVRGMLPRLREVPRQVVDDMATIAYNTMRAGAGRHSPRPMGTGRLFRSLFREGQGGLVQTVGHDLGAARHAEYVVFPTRPHWIRPKRAKMLSWIGGVGFNKRIFAREVWHPGYRGDNYRDEAINDVFAQFDAIVDANLNEATL
jgi:hypothetical protein